MLISGRAHTVGFDEGRVVDLGVTRMRILAAGEETTGRAFTLAEFAGAAGPWTVPHMHRQMEESFFVLDGEFTFTVGTEQIQAGLGSYVLVPRGTPHTLAAGASGGRCLVLMVPGGNEDMFIELGELGPDALRDPKVRAAIAARYDSIPV